MAYSNAVAYGWELLKHGAVEVYVSINGWVWICGEQTHPDKQNLQEVLTLLQAYVSLEQDRFAETIPVHVSAQKFGVAAFNYKGRDASRNGYLSKLGGYVSKFFGLPVQFGLKRNTDLELVSNTVDVVKITGGTSLLRAGCSGTFVDAINGVMRHSKVFWYDQYVLKYRKFPEEPVAVIAVECNDLLWIAPLYGDHPIAGDVLCNVERLVDVALRQALDRPVEVYSTEYRLDI